MKFTAKQYAQALHDALENTAPAEVDRVLDNFVQVLAENNDLGLFDEIAAQLHKQELEKKGIKQAEVTSAHSLNSENEKQVIDTLNRHVKSKFELKRKIEENLIGGVVVQVDDLMIDASIKKNLEELRKELSS